MAHRPTDAAAGIDVRLDVDQLQADPQNRRMHDARNVSMVADALRAVGAARSIVVDEDDIVLAGNGVIAGAKQAGIAKVRIIEADGTEVIAVRRRGLTPDQKRALAMYDNRTAELAAWNPEQLTADRAAGLDLQPWFSAAELDHLLHTQDRTPGRTAPDDVPAPRPTDITEGDLFALGAHRLLCGDSTRAADVQRVFGSDHAGLCFTSPPYADQRDYHGGELAPATLAEFLTVADPFVTVFAVNLGVVRRGGFVVPYWDAYIAAAARAGLGVLSWNVWSREGQKMSVGQLTAMFPIQHEFIFVLGRRPVALVPTIPNKHADEAAAPVDRGPDGVLVHKRGVTIRPLRELGTVLSTPAVHANTDHPAQFPVALAADYIQAFTGDVYEPFGGAGTTLIASEQLTRRCRCIELAPAYCQTIIDRWEAFTGQQAVKL